MTGPAPSCYTQDNTRAEGLSGHQIYTQMTSGPGTGSAQQAANAAAALERTYAGIEARLKRVGETLGEAWTGTSADAARAAGNPINQAMIQMQDALRQADHSLSNQVYQFNHNKAQLKNVPEQKPETGFWDDISPWDTDAEDAVNKYNSEEAHNRKIYSEFQSASNTNRGDLPREFPGVTADNLDVEIADNGGGGNNTGNTTNTSGIGPSGTSNFPTSTGSPQGPPGSTWTPPGTITGDQTTISGTGGGGGGGGGGGVNKPGDLIGKPPVGNVIERPPNAGIPPIGVPGGPGLGGPGGGAGRGPGGGAGGGKLGGGAGRFGGGGLGGVGTGSGTSAQQPGGKAGVFGGMGENAAGRGAAGGAAGAAGRAGAAGMGGMGGHGAKGQGDEDTEHKTADYLVTEENTNEIIGDMPMVAPPTIGG
jgi:uncharacterized protein YukE